MMMCRDHEPVFKGDDDLGVCSKCGAECEWHWEKEEGNVEDYYWSGKERVIDNWYEPYELGE